MLNGLNLPGPAAVVRRNCCAACSNCMSVAEAVVQCRVASGTVSLTIGECRLGKWKMNPQPLQAPAPCKSTIEPVYANPISSERLVVGVFSTVDEAYQDRRVKCQQTWLPVIESLGVEVLFLIGTGRQEHDPYLVHSHEHRRIGTELHLPCPDDYASLPQKIRWLCRWAILNRSFDYLFKCDDDTYIVPDRLLGVNLSGVDYLGSEWAPGVAYASGGAGYFLSNHAAEAVAANLVQAEGAEDLLVGELLHRNGFHFTKDPRFIAFANENLRPKPNNDLITAHANQAPWSEHCTTWRVEEGDRYGQVLHKICHPRRTVGSTKHASELLSPPVDTLSSLSNSDHP